MTVMVINTIDKLKRRTPKGHWRISGQGWGEFCRVNTISDGSDFDGEYARESEANARLISAAPDLLDALRCMTEVLEMHGIKGPTLEKAKTAIKKR